MGRQKAVRDRKSEMTSCWVCAAFIAIVNVVINVLLGFQSKSVFNLVLIILFVIWVAFAIFYTIQYRKWKKKNNM